MAFPTWNPLAKPQLGSGFKDDEIILEAQFGDGYRQTLPDGLNAQFVAGDLSWNGITSAELTDLLEFWAEHGKAGRFYWTIPGESAPRLFAFTSPFARSQISEVRNDGTRLYSTSVSIEQRFDLA